MSHALKLAETARKLDEVPVGAVITHRGVIVGEGFNRRETDQNPVAHAEILAIEAAAKKLGSWRLIDCVLHVTLEPCPMCLAACQQARIQEVVYGAQDSKGGALSLGYKLHEDARTNHRFLVRHEPDEASSQILKDFFAAKRTRDK
jgi:tRNA(adenine34) deaminase